MVKITVRHKNLFIKEDVDEIVKVLRQFSNENKWDSSIDIIWNFFMIDDYHIDISIEESETNGFVLTRTILNQVRYRAFILKVVGIRLKIGDHTYQDKMY